MARRSNINWDSKEVLSILNDNTSLENKAKSLGITIQWLCRKMKSLGIKHNCYWRTGFDKPATNKEIKVRYDAKRKAIGWKYLYQAGGKLQIE